jgi:hypothetical protein
MGSLLLRIGLIFNDSNQTAKLLGKLDNLSVINMENTVDNMRSRE